MSLLKIVAAGLLSVCCISSAAFALSITNRDDRDHKVTIIEDGVSKDQTLKPDATADGVCTKGCVIRLNDSEDDEYELEGSETVSIEDGYLYYEGPDAPAEAAPSDGKATGPKR